MGRVVKGFGAVVFGLLALVVLLYVASRAMPIPRHEAEALARVEALPPLEGKNGFAAIWSLALDVDAGRAQALLVEEARRLASSSAPDSGVAYSPYISVLEGVPLLVAQEATDPKPCGMVETGCLHRVREDLHAYSSWVERRRVTSARVERLDAYGHFRTTLPSRMDTPFPSYGPLIEDLTVQAQRFAVGQSDIALQGVCRNASIARKLVASGDNLLGSMVGVALYQGSATLLVDMLAELPPDYPLPALCDQVFAAGAPMAQDICSTLRGEGRWMTEGFRASSKHTFKGKVADRLFLDVDKTMAHGAMTYEWFCGEEANASIASDTPLRGYVQPSRISFRCIANAIGCTLVSLQAPAYSDYTVRLQDAAMRQKAVGTWLWLRAHVGQDRRPLAERLRFRPAAFKSASRDIRVEGDRLVVPMNERRPGQDDAWHLPVPVWMSDAAAP